MTKHERKKDPATPAKTSVRGKQAERALTSSEERFQRVLLLLILTGLLTFIIIPKGVLTPTSFTPGDIAPRDIKATRSILLPDEELTTKKRAEAEKAVPALYDFDAAAGSVVADQIRQVLEYLRQMNEAGAEQGDMLAGLAADLGINATEAELKTLLELASNPTSSNRVNQLMQRAYQNKIVGNLKLFEADRARGVVFRKLENQTEAADDPREKVIGLGSLQETVKAELKDSSFSKAQTKTLEGLILPLLRPNVTFNQNETEVRKQAAREGVQPVLIQVKKGEMIVREGDPITVEQLNKLNALRDESNRGTLLRNAAGLLASLFLLVFIGHRFASRNISKYRAKNRDLLFLVTTFVCLVLLLKVSIFIAAALGGAFTYIDQAAYYYAFPFAFGAMVVRIVLNSEIALVFIPLTAVVIGFLFGNSFAIMVYAMLGSLAGAHWVKHLTERSALYRAGLRLGMYNFLVILALHLMTSQPYDWQLVYKLCFGLAGGIATAILVTGFVPLIESLFRYTTNIKLLELANMNNPILRKLMIQAPGTYHHSIIVGNLAEAAAEAIGANPLTVRVASYYHDIGKIKKPLYFIENIGNQENKHDKLSPSMSALILMAHVKDGVEMARENRLGQKQIDIIRQHHGTSLMKFFYDKAKSKSNPGVQQVDPRDYRYPGPKPQTREAALIMLADAIEAASRTLADPTPARVQGMVQKIINNIFIDGQLDECELTLKDLHNIAKSFNRVLGGIFHHRVDYPEPVSKERNLDKGGSRKNAEDRDRKSSEENQDQEEDDPKGSSDDLKRLGMS